MIRLREETVVGRQRGDAVGVGLHARAHVAARVFYPEVHPPGAREEADDGRFSRSPHVAIPPGP